MSREEVKIIMYITVASSPEIADAYADLDTGLSIARACSMLYLEEEHKCLFEESRHDLYQMVGAVIDYIRSAQETLEAIEKGGNNCEQ